MDRRRPPTPPPTHASEYRFDVPHELVAAEQVVPREYARLYNVLANGETEFKGFRTFPSVLLRNDVLVLDDAGPGSSFAFSEDALAAIRARGVVVARVAAEPSGEAADPIAVDEIPRHRPPTLRYTIPEATAAAIGQARRDGDRVIAAGVGVLRVLEASAAPTEAVVGGEGETDLFITPGFAFRAATSLLTNFHPSGSSSIVTLAAFLGYENAKIVYASAVERRYRFGPVGDSLFVARRDPQRVMAADPGALAFSLDRRKQPR